MFSIMRVVRLKLVHDYYISSTRVRLNRDTKQDNPSKTRPDVSDMPPAEEGGPDGKRRHISHRKRMSEQQAQANTKTGLKYRLK